MRWSRLSVVATLITLAAGVVPPSASAVPTFSTLFSFCNDPNFGCENTGAGPQASLVSDAQGNLYGTAEVGNDNGHGTAFGLFFDPAQHTYTFQLLYRFCQVQNGFLCLDGLQPASNLILDANGNLYGTTTAGGKNNQGIVFELFRHNHYVYTLKVLYNFCAKANCRDGAFPVAGLTYQGEQTGALYDGISPLYGTTQKGGLSTNGGVAYRYIPQGTQRYRVVRYFCFPNNSCAGGSTPSGLTPDADGNFYGVAELGGRLGHGLVFKLSPNGEVFSEKVLYNFCRKAGCTDGRDPVGRVAFDSGGKLYGTTSNGGRNDGGVVFRLDIGSRETVLHSFCQKQPNCDDGSSPAGGVVVAPNGDLFGTTLGGGNSPSCCGVLYQIDAGKESVLHTFCPNPGLNCDPDGESPAGGLIMDGSGSLYGTTQHGGEAETFVSGTVFKFTP